MSSAATDSIGRESAPVQPRSSRDHILDAAAALFAEHGYAATTTRAIAERAGIRQASLYYHFAGKDEILLELLEASVRPSLDFAARVEHEVDAAAALYALAAFDVGTLLASPHNIGSLYLAHEVDEPRFVAFQQHRAELQAAYVRLAGAVQPNEDPAFSGACCMQLVELVVQMRRTADPDPGAAHRIAAACLRVVGADLASAEAGARLLRMA